MAHSFKNTNKKYAVYGIGNALVDMEFEVTVDFLKKMEVEKGLMTLVDEDRQKFLIQNMNGLQHKRAGGGSAANTMVALSSLGAKGFYSCKVSNDETGDFFLKDLTASGLSTNLNEKNRASGTTGKCMVMVTPDADRTMNTFLGITSTFSVEELVEDEIKNSTMLYMEGYLVASPTGKLAAVRAREIAEKNGVLKVLTFSDPNMVLYFKEGLMEMIGNKPLDLLFCNESEALAFTGKAHLEDALNEIKKITKAYAVTTGSKGATLFDGEKTIEIVTMPVKAIDTNGAGDLFAGSFMYALSEGKSFSDAGRFACAAASKLVTQFGARLSKNDLLDLKNTYYK